MSSSYLGRVEIRMNRKTRWFKVVRQIRVIAEIKNIKKEKNLNTQDGQNRRLVRDDQREPQGSI